MKSSKITLIVILLLVSAIFSGCAADATLQPERSERLTQPETAPLQPETDPATPTTPVPEPTLPPTPPAPPPAVEAPPQREPGQDAPRTIRAVVSRHVDGDTARFRIEGAEEKVRFIGVDTPEVFGGAEPLGREASSYTRRAIPVGANVWLETDVENRDRHGRLLAYVWVGQPLDSTPGEVRSKMLNARLVSAGYAKVYTFPPNVKYAELFRTLQVEAREADRGLWGSAAVGAPPVPPPSAAPQSGDTTVFITRTGERYHDDGCRFLARSRIPISLTEARARGFEACRVCW